MNPRYEEKDLLALDATLDGAGCWIVGADLEVCERAVVQSCSGRSMSLCILRAESGERVNRLPVVNIVDARLNRQA